MMNYTQVAAQYTPGNIRICQREHRDPQYI